MSLIDMNVKREDRSYPSSDCGSGLTLWISPEQCKALGIEKAPEAGSEIMLSAKAKIKSITTDAVAEGQKEQRMSIEITHMEISGSSSGASDADVLYSK